MGLRQELSCGAGSWWRPFVLSASGPCGAGLASRVGSGWPVALRFMVVGRVLEVLCGDGTTRLLLFGDGAIQVVGVQAGFGGQHGYGTWWGVGRLPAVSRYREVIRLQRIYNF